MKYDNRRNYVVKKINITTSTVTAICMLLLVSCAGLPPSSVYTDAGEIGGVTLALDDHDYDLASEGIAQELLSRGLPEGYIVALGPVDTRDCKYNVQIKTLQKSLQVIFNKEGTLQFTAVIDTAGGGNSSAQEIYKLIEYNYFIGNSASAADLQKFGKIAKVNGILFGRVSCIERKIKGAGSVITYRFVWELADTETGIIKVSHEKKIRKRIR